MPTSLSLDIQIRQASADDIPSLLELLVLAPDDGTLYQYLNVLEHPEEMQRIHAAWLYPTFQDRTNLTRIALIKEDNVSKVIGFSSWMKYELDPQRPGQTRAAEISQSSISTSQLASSSDSQNSSSALILHKARAESLNRARKPASPSPTLTTPCYELNGIAVHPHYRRQGVGSLLMDWGLKKATEESVPIFVTGETAGVDYYRKAFGFRPLRDTEYWLDKDGTHISREEVERGNKEWEQSQGGVLGAQLVWVPDGCTTFQL